MNRPCYNFIEICPYCGENVRAQCKNCHEFIIQKLRKEIDELKSAKLKPKTCSICQNETIDYISGQSQRFNNVELILCIDCVFDNLLMKAAKNDFKMNQMKQTKPNESGETEGTQMKPNNQDFFVLKI